MKPNESHEVLASHWGLYTEATIALLGSLMSFLEGKGMKYQFLDQE